MPTARYGRERGGGLTFEAIKRLTQAEEFKDLGHEARSQARGNKVKAALSADPILGGILGGIGNAIYGAGDISRERKKAEQPQTASSSQAQNAPGSGSALADLAVVHAREAGGSDFRRADSDNRFAQWTGVGASGLNALKSIVGLVAGGIGAAGATGAAGSASSGAAVGAGAAGGTPIQRSGTFAAQGGLADPFALDQSSPFDGATGANIGLRQQSYPQQATVEAARSALRDPAPPQTPTDYDRTLQAVWNSFFPKARYQLPQGTQYY